MAPCLHVLAISFLGLLRTDGEPYYDSVWKSAATPHLSSKDQKPRAFSAGLDTASYFAQTAAAAAAAVAVHETATVCAILNAHRHDDFASCLARAATVVSHAGTRRQLTVCT